MNTLKRIFLLLFVLSAFVSFSQNKISNGSLELDTTFRLHSVKYPEYAKEMNIQGTVIVSFTIDSTCTISNIKISSSLNEKYCDPVLIQDIRKEEKLLKSENKSKCKARNVKFPVRYVLQ